VKKEEDLKFKALAEKKGKEVLLSIDKALKGMESSAQTLAANTGGGAAAPAVERALTWFNRQNDFVKRGLMLAALLTIVFFIMVHTYDEEVEAGAHTRSHFRST